MKIAAVVSFGIFVLLISFYQKEKKNTYNKIIYQNIDKKVKSKPAFTSQIMSTTTSNINHSENSNKAYISKQIDHNSGQEKSFVVLPKGKRLYNEEELKEIARDVTI